MAFALPKIPLEIITGAIDVISMIFTSISNKKAKELSQKDAVKKGAETVNDICDISKSLNELITSIKPEMQSVEKKILNSLSYFQGDFIFLAEDKNNIFTDKTVRQITRMTEKVNRKFEGCLLTELYKELSLDNPTCRDILYLPAGSNKETKIEQFIENSITKALQTIISNIKDEINFIAEEISCIVTDELSVVENHQNELIFTCEKLQNALENTESNSIRNNAIEKLIFVEFCQDMLKEEL